MYLVKLKIVAILLSLSFVSLSKEQYAWEWIKDDAFKQSYQLAIKDIDTEKWVALLSGPSTKSQEIVIEESLVDYISLCKAHDCANKNLSLFYFPQKQEVYGLIISERSYFIGEPSLEIKEQLIKIHQKNYKYAVIPTDLK